MSVLKCHTIRLHVLASILNATIVFRFFPNFQYFLLKSKMGRILTGRDSAARRSERPLDTEPSLQQAAVFADITRVMISLEAAWLVGRGSRLGGCIYHELAAPQSPTRQDNQKIPSSS